MHVLLIVQEESWGIYSVELTPLFDNFLRLLFIFDIDLILNGYVIHSINVQVVKYPWSQFCACYHIHASRGKF